jgi:uncharacterized protein
MPFNLFRKKKPEQEVQTSPPQEEQPQQEKPTQSSQETTPESIVAEPAPEMVTATQEQTPPLAEPAAEKKIENENQIKSYLKAMPLRELSDLEKVKAEVINGNIIILKITPLAQKSIEDVKSAVNDLYQFSDTIGGDIARLGEERVVICPKTIKIWREKTPNPVTNEALPTAA